MYFRMNCIATLTDGYGQSFERNSFLAMYDIVLSYRILVVYRIRIDDGVRRCCRWYQCVSFCVVLSLLLSVVVVGKYCWYGVGVVVVVVVVVVGNKGLTGCWRGTVSVLLLLSVTKD